MEKLDNLLSRYLENLIAYIPEIVTSLIILGLGMWAIRFLQKVAQKIFVKNKK